MREREDDAGQAITLVVEWRGGRGIDVVSIVHNGQLIRYEPRRVRVEPGSATVEYEVPRAPRHAIRAVLAFIGDARRELALHCLVDGVPAGGAIRAPFAEHRWEVRATW